MKITIRQLKQLIKEEVKKAKLVEQGTSAARVRILGPGAVYSDAPIERALTGRPITIVTARPVAPEQMTTFQNELNNATASLGLMDIFGLNGTGTNFTARLPGTSEVGRARGIDLGNDAQRLRFLRQILIDLRGAFNDRRSGIVIRSIAWNPPAA